jgi:hypothetical protein
VPIAYIKWRSAFLYAENTGNPCQPLLDALNLSESEITLFQKMETAFGLYVYDECSPRVYKKRYQAQVSSVKTIVNDLAIAERELKNCVRERDCAWAQYAEKDRILDETIRKYEARLNETIREIRFGTTNAD